MATAARSCPGSSLERCFGERGQHDFLCAIGRGQSLHELLGAMTRQQPIRSDYEIVRDYWRGQNLWPEFEKGWRRTLHDGLISDTSFPPKRVQLKTENLKTASIIQHQPSSANQH